MTRMRAIVVRRFGGPEVLAVEERPVPRPADHEVLVRVAAAGVNPVDVSNHVDGTWAGIELPYTPGSDVSGVVYSVGASVSAFAIGDEVYALTDFLHQRSGSYAEFQAVAGELLVRKPPELTHLEAASIPLAAGTAYEAVVRRLDVRAGERVLILGAAGGVGGFATQLAVRAGAEVVAVARRSADAYLRELGVRDVVDPWAPDSTERLRAVAQNVDAIVDLVGSGALSANLVHIRERGRAATIASLDGDLELAIDRNITIHGVLVRPDAARLSAISELVSRGELSTTLRGTYELADAGDAHREVARGGAPGKTVIAVRGCGSGWVPQ